MPWHCCAIVFLLRPPVYYALTPPPFGEEKCCKSMPNMTGRPGCRTMEMNGGSSASYLARTPCARSFCTLINRGGNRRAFKLPGEGRDHFHCTVEPSSGHIWCRAKPKKESLRGRGGGVAIADLLTAWSANTGFCSTLTVSSWGLCPSIARTPFVRYSDTLALWQIDYA